MTLAFHHRKTDMHRKSYSRTATLRIQAYIRKLSQSVHAVYMAYMPCDAALIWGFPHPKATVTEIL